MYQVREVSSKHILKYIIILLTYTLQQDDQDLPLVASLYQQNTVSFTNYRVVYNG